MWRGLGERNSSDEEWEQEFWKLAQERPWPPDEQIDTCGMIDNIFQNCNAAEDGERRLWEEVAATFAIADNIHAESVAPNNCNEPSYPDPDTEDVPEDGGNIEEGVHANFDLHALEDTLCALYNSAKFSKLAGTILLLNLCTVHGVSNYFMDELFSILHGHILHEGNLLPQNHYTAKTLTRKSWLDIQYHPRL